MKGNKIAFSLFIIFAIAAVSVFVVHSINKTHKKVLSFDEIDWDI